MPKATLLDQPKQTASSPRRASAPKAQVPAGFAGASTKPQALNANSVMHLQRLAGNSAVSQMLGAKKPVPVQRWSLFGFLKEGKDKGAADTVTSSGADVLGQAPLTTVGNSFGSLNPKNANKQTLSGMPNISDKTQHQGSGASSAGDILGGGFALTGLLASGKELSDNREEYEKGKTANSELRKYAAKRGIKSSGGDVATNAYTLLGSAGSATGDIMSAAGSTVGSTVGGATGGALLPLQVYQLGRSIRKLVKQGLRYDRLKKMSEDPDANPKTILDKLKAEEDRLTSERTDAADALKSAEEKKALADALVKRNGRGSTARLVEKLQGEIDQLTSLIKDTDTKLAQITQDRADRKTLHDEVLAKFGDLHGKEAPSVDDIRLYALGKSQRGIVKKTIGAFGGLLGTAGGIALTVGFGVALAGGTAAMMATPVGWAMAGAAAVIGLGIAGYKVIRRFQAFRKERQAQETKGTVTPAKHGWLKDLGNALAFWRKTPSERDHYAEALIHYAQKGNAKEKAQANELIVNLLGKQKSKKRQLILDDVLKADKNTDKDMYKAAVSVLAAKMGS